MGSILIILHPTRFNFFFRIVLRIQTLIPKAAIEGFNERTMPIHKWKVALNLFNLEYYNYSNLDS